MYFTFKFFNSLVPVHLRTKYEPEVEKKEAALSEKTSAISDESTQVTNESPLFVKL